MRGRGLEVEGRKSRVASRGSHVEGRGQESKVKGQNLSVCMFLIVLKNEVFSSVLLAKHKRIANRLSLATPGKNVIFV